MWIGRSMQPDMRVKDYMYGASSVLPAWSIQLDMDLLK